MSLLHMSASAAILIIAVVILRALAINRLPKKTFLVMWGVVVVRLLVPFSIPSSLSFYSLVNRASASIEILHGATTAPTTILSDIPTLLSPTVQPIASPSNIPWILFIWAIGFISCALFFAVSYWSCRRKFATAIPVNNMAVEQWQALHTINRTITICQSDRITAPLTYGTAHPVILLPKGTDWENIDQLHYILAHEHVHIRRCDSLTKLLLIFALCVHWFNPLVWVMFALANRDIELSCDETVVMSFGEATKAAYARVLIGMEEQKGGLMPLCNSFSKNAIEERITAIMKIKKTSVIAVLAAIVLVVGITTAFATSAASSPNSSQASDGKTFGEHERQRLNAFKFDGYENMSVASYQQKAWVLLDTADYHEVIERISQNNMLYKMRYNNNQDAAFLFNILVPLSAEKWQTRDFGGYTQAPNGDVQGDQAMLEYQIFLTISDANRLTVGQYDKARQGMEDGLHNILQSKINAELQNESTMDTAIRTEIAALKSRWEAPALQIAVEYSFMPLSLYESPNGYVLNSYEQEKRPYPHATEADYQSLLKLKTADYQNQSVSSFNSALLEWANEDYERNERINVDRGWNDFEVALTPEERSFVTLTTLASGVENAKLIQSHYTGREKEDPILGSFNLSKEVNDNSRFAYTNLWYQLTYHVSDENKLTIGERDQALAGVINGIQQYWDNTGIDTLLTMNEDTIAKEIKAIAAKYSNDSIIISFANDGVGFECMSEPKI